MAPIHFTLILRLADQIGTGAKEIDEVDSRRGEENEAHAAVESLQALLPLHSQRALLIGRLVRIG